MPCVRLSTLDDLNKKSLSEGEREMTKTENQFNPMRVCSFNKAISSM